VAPGYIETDLTRHTAVGRTGTPDDIAEAVQFFVGEGAGFVTGQVLYVAGTPHV
jgi:3-oxoacyl-[acyl-carrier protein] reductase